jgi:hypothetical protein
VKDKLMLYQPKKNQPSQLVKITKINQMIMSKQRQNQNLLSRKLTRKTLKNMKKRRSNSKRRKRSSMKNSQEPKQHSNKLPLSSLKFSHNELPRCNLLAAELAMLEGEDVVPDLSPLMLRQPNEPRISLTISLASEQEE